MLYAHMTWVNLNCQLSTWWLLGWPCDHSQHLGLLQTSSLLEKATDDNVPHVRRLQRFQCQLPGSALTLHNLYLVYQFRRTGPGYTATFWWTPVVSLKFYWTVFSLFCCTVWLYLNVVYLKNNKYVPCPYQVLYRNASGSLGEHKMPWEHRLTDKHFHSFFKFSPTSTSCMYTWQSAALSTYFNFFSQCFIINFCRWQELECLNSTVMS